MVHRKHKGRTGMKKTLTKDVTKGVSIVKNTSKKYIPKVTKGLEDVGSKVGSTAKKSLPMLQQASRKFLSIFGIGKSKSRKNRKY